MSDTASEFRFQVALSFPGEHRARVERIAEGLADRLGHGKVLYDKWYGAELARPNLDVFLPGLYHKESLLLVFFLCSEYATKEWCGLEWRAGRDLLKQGKDARLMFLRLDHADIPGLYSIDGYLDISGMPDVDAAGEIMKRLATLATVPAIDIETAVRDLRAQTFEDIEYRCGKTRILTMEQPIELGGIYTDVNILEKRTANARKSRSQLIEEGRLGAFDRFGIPGGGTKRIPGLQAFDHHRRVIVYGKPGAGKTTFLKHMAMECANGNFRAELVPAFVTLREFAEADGAPTMFQHIQKQWRGNLNSLRVFEEGRALVLLDGLDEVSDRYFDRVRKAIGEFTAEFHRCPIALTCRIAAREYAFEQFAEVEVADFSDLQIQTFATRWFGVQGEQRQAPAFVAKLKSNRPILELASSPLLLTLLCLVFQERNDFEGTRAELYREGFEILLRKWDAKRGIERDRPYGLSITDLENLLCEIAYRRFLVGEYFFDQADLEKQIEAFFAERNLLGAGQELLAERVLNSIESHLGLLVQRAARVYSFSHLTFQEYLTAQRVAKKTTLLAEIGPHVGDGRWREVWLLLVTMVDADDIIQELKRQIDMLVEKESEIQRYLEWGRQKAAIPGGNAYKQPALRACCLAMALAIFGNRILANARAGDALNVVRSRPNAIDLDFSLAHALDRAFDNTIVPTLRLDGSLVTAISLDRDLDFDHDLDNDLAKALDLALFRALAGAVAHAAIVAPAMVPEIQKLRDEVRLTLDRTWWREHWPEWREMLRDTAIRHRNIGHDWKFTSRQMVLLGEYYRSNVFLVECMTAARGLTNKTRQTVEDGMLLPLDQIQRG